MSNFYVDTSALAKRYLVETGSDWTRSWIEAAARNVIIICDLTPVELVSLLSRRQREGSVSAHHARLLEADFYFHLAREYLVLPVNAASLARAPDLVKRYFLRTLDSIHLACALECARALGESPRFVSGDQKLLLAAAAEGFSVDDPNDHP